MAAEWKKIVLSGADATLNDVVVNSITGSMTGSFKGDGSGLTGVASSLGIAGSTGTGTVNLTNQSLTIAGTANEIEAAAANQTITIGLPNAVTLGTSLTVPTASIGELVVTGTSTIVNTTNLTVEDRFVLLASGSTTGDAGIVVGRTTVTGVQFGKAFFFDGDHGRWSYNNSVSEGNTGAVTPDAYAGVVYTGAIDQAPAVAPKYGGATYGQGSLFVDTVTGDIYIYTKDGDTVDTGAVADFGSQGVSQG